MLVLKILLVTVEVITGLLIVGIVLLQKSKDDGLGLAFGAGMGESLFGANAGTVLTKITVGLGIVFVVNTIVLDRLYSVARPSSLMDAVPGAVAPAAPAPASPMEAAPLSVGGDVPLTMPDQASAQPVEAPAAAAPASPETAPAAPEAAPAPGPQ